jgi:hypothetical protein
MQIGRRVRRLERAQVAADRQSIKKRSEIPDVNADLDEAMGMNLDARYDIPKNRNDPVDIYSFVRAHQGDPAIKVCVPFELYEDCQVTYVRVSFQN